MKDTECNKFLTLLMGECWHEWDGMYCKLCKVQIGDLPLSNKPHPDYLSNPLPVLNWMREHMPEEWEEYLLHIFSTTWTLKLSDDLFRILDLRNLVDYLIQNTEAPFAWGFTPCDGFPACMSGERDKCIFPDKSCEGNGETRGYIHPALVYARSIKKDVKE